MEQTDPLSPVGVRGIEVGAADAQVIRQPNLTGDRRSEIVNENVEGRVRGIVEADYGANVYTAVQIVGGALEHPEPALAHRPVAGVGPPSRATGATKVPIHLQFLINVVVR